MNHLFSSLNRLVNKINLFLIIITYVLIQSCTGFDAKRVKITINLQDLIENTEFFENVDKNISTRSRIIRLGKGIQEIDEIDEDINLDLIDICKIINIFGKKYTETHKDLTKKSIILKLNYQLIEKLINSMEIEKEDKKKILENILKFQYIIYNIIDQLEADVEYKEIKILNGIKGKEQKKLEIFRKLKSIFLSTKDDNEQKEDDDTEDEEEVNSLDKDEDQKVEIEVQEDDKKPDHKSIEKSKKNEHLEHLKSNLNMINLDVFTVFDTDDRMLEHDYCGQIKCNCCLQIIAQNDICTKGDHYSDTNENKDLCNNCFKNFNDFMNGKKKLIQKTCSHCKETFYFTKQNNICQICKVQL